MMDSQHQLADALSGREINKAMKDIFRETFHNLGGAAWLTSFVNDSPANARVFVSILGKLIPPTPASQEKPVAPVIELAWVRPGRLSYKEALDGTNEELQES